MPFAPDSWAAQPSTSKGLGQHFTSPHGPRRQKRLGNKTLVTIPGRELKWQ